MRANPDLLNHKRGIRMRRIGLFEAITVLLIFAGIVCACADVSGIRMNDRL